VVLQAALQSPPAVSHTRSNPALLEVAKTLENPEFKAYYTLALQYPQLPAGKVLTRTTRNSAGIPPLSKKERQGMPVWLSLPLSGTDTPLPPFR
jgi:hypothetical protein